LKEYAVVDTREAVRIEPQVNPCRRGVTLREAFRQARQLAGWTPGEREGSEICRRCGGVGCGLCDGEGHLAVTGAGEDEIA